MTKVQPHKIHIGLNEEGARLLHRLLREESKKETVDDEALRTWFRLDAAMKRASIEVKS